MKRIFYITLGIIIGSVVVVYAQNIHSKNVEFTPQNNKWNLENNTVEEALNSLYDKSVECINGVYHHDANTQFSINVGFVPSKVNLNFHDTIGNYQAYIVYDKNVGTKVLYIDSASSSRDLTSMISINNNITSSVYDYWVMYEHPYDIYYTACK